MGPVLRRLILRWVDERGRVLATAETGWRKRQNGLLCWQRCAWKARGETLERIEAKGTSCVRHMAQLSDIIASGVEIDALPECGGLRQPGG